MNLFKIRFGTIRGTKLQLTTIFTANGIIKEQLFLNPFFCHFDGFPKQEKNDQSWTFQIFFPFDQESSIIYGRDSIRDLEGLDSICV